MRRIVALLVTLCCLPIGGMTQSKQAAAEDNAMTASDLQEICIGSSPEAKAACRFYLLGVTQGISMGISIADGKTQGGRPCVPDNLSASAIELGVKMKLGLDLMVFPDDPQAGGIRCCRCYPRFDFSMPQVTLIRPEHCRDGLRGDVTPSEILVPLGSGALPA